MEMETSRIHRAREKDKSRLRARIAADPGDWRNRLLQIEQEAEKKVGAAECEGSDTDQGIASLPSNVEVDIHEPVANEEDDKNK